MNSQKFFTGRATGFLVLLVLVGIAACIIPTYISTLPVDPSGGTYTSNASYDTQYTVIFDATSRRVTVAALNTEIATLIAVTR